MVLVCLVRNNDKETHPGHLSRSTKLLTTPGDPKYTYFRTRRNIDLHINPFFGKRQKQKNRDGHLGIQMSAYSYINRTRKLFMSRVDEKNEAITKHVFATFCIFKNEEV